ncbi:hypothetical protein CEW89_08500 [Celeribacter ethanolicus]|uniref:Uncharacterized protein n=1 Tax=Celeribacter ethanolicus TaxID=1758178 RepID=A0A291GBP3_9RHOB|nr:hypothetical protein [Celeribacter ethanolicus]ATG47611.1 hypothetical protein CEW89_08500 [Celeribacter ethanolicus]
MRDHGFEEYPIKGQTAALLLKCARVAMLGHDVAFVVHNGKMVRYARDLCAAQVRPCAVGKSYLIYGTARVKIYPSEAAYWGLTGWGGFMVLDHELEPGSSALVAQDLCRVMRDMRDLTNLQFPEGEFERLSAHPLENMPPEAVWTGGRGIGS